MDPEDAFHLAHVLRERGQGVIQSLVQLRMECRQEISEELARISGQPVIHNNILVIEPSGSPTDGELKLAGQWLQTLDWVEGLERKGLNVFLQSATMRNWQELNIEHMTIFNAIPVFEEFSRCETTECYRVMRRPAAGWYGINARSVDLGQSHRNSSGVSQTEVYTGAYDRLDPTAVRPEQGRGRRRRRSSGR
jgi:hypothetical protein